MFSLVNLAQLAQSTASGWKIGQFRTRARGKTVSNRLLGVVTILTDITPLHELQEEREDLLRTVSHDLRNPLIIIQGLAQLLARALEKAGLAGTV